MSNARPIALIILALAKGTSSSTSSGPHPGCASSHLISLLPFLESHGCDQSGGGSRARIGMLNLVGVSGLFLPEDTGSSGMVGSAQEFGCFSEV